MMIVLLGLLSVNPFSCGISKVVACKQTDCDRSVDIAIIGAGIAGTSFAYKLRHKELTIELLEYSDRIGGRIFTTSLPNVPDVNLELGAMRIIEGQHIRVQKLVQELNLTLEEFRLGRPDLKQYFLRGRKLNQDQVRRGEVPYGLSPEEKANAGHLALYYLEKLMGFKGGITEEQGMNARIPDGRTLTEITLEDALDLVATSEGKQFVKDINAFQVHFSRAVNALDFFLDNQHLTKKNKRLLTVKEGMSSITRSMVQSFLQSSYRHTVTLNRKLEAITDGQNGFYKLLLRETVTTDGITLENETTEKLCARKVVLAIPHHALIQLKWQPFRHPRTKEALHSVTLHPASKVFFTFPTAFWLNSSAYSASVMISNVPFRNMLDLKPSSLTGDCAMIASYADYDDTIYLQKINSEGGLAQGSVAGYNRVSDRFKQDLLRHLAQAFGISRKQLPEPVSAISQFWSTYPFGGAWTKWRTGCNFSDVMETIRRPSFIDHVYIVGSDYIEPGKTVWTEGALKSVDQVYENYFT